MIKSKANQVLNELGYSKAKKKIVNLRKHNEGHWEFEGENCPDSLIGRKFKSQNEAEKAASECEFKY